MRASPLQLQLVRGNARLFPCVAVQMSDTLWRLSDLPHCCLVLSLGSYLSPQAFLLEKHTVDLLPCQKPYGGTVQRLSRETREAMRKERGVVA